MRKVSNHVTMRVIFGVRPKYVVSSEKMWMKGSLYSRRALAQEKSLMVRYW